jgi:ribulose-5-phosphate 4-epimerase/fuculose-1-phosphate aldolase
MPRDIAPGTVSSDSDLVEYYVSDASPVNTLSPAGYAERYIHSEIYKKYASVQSVIHSHSPAVTPYTISCNGTPPPALAIWIADLFGSCAFEAMFSHGWIPW